MYYYFMEVLQSIKLTEFTTAIERQDLYLLEPENNDTILIYSFRFNVGYYYYYYFESS